MEQPLPASRTSAYPPAAPNPYMQPADYGRPLDTLLAGATLALGTMAAILAIAYKTWYLHEVEQNLAIFIIGFLSFVYTGGVYIFSYAWERSDPSKAIRLTVVIVIGSAVAVLITVVVLAMLSKFKGGGDKVASTSSGGSDLPLGMNLGGIIRTAESYVDDGRVRIEEEEAAPESELITVTCEKCGQKFMPLPPRALCPNCGWAAISETAKIA